MAAATNFPEVAQTSSLVDTMVTIDDHFAWLKQSQKAGWKSPPKHPDISPDHESTMLWELFREIPRATDLSKRPTDFRAKLADARQAATSLKELLHQPAGAPGVDAAFQKVGESCAACHKVYRNE